MRTSSSLGLLLSVPVAALVAGCSSELKVSELEPGQGTYMGGEEVAIRGANFPLGRGVQVRFGKRDATNVVVESPTKLKVTTPAGDKNAAVDVTVVFDDGRAFLLKNAWRYLDAAGSQRAVFDKTLNKMGDKKEEEKK